MLNERVLCMKRHTPNCIMGKKFSLVLAKHGRYTLPESQICKCWGLNETFELKLMSFLLAKNVKGCDTAYSFSYFDPNNVTFFVNRNSKH